MEELDFTTGLRIKAKTDRRDSEASITFQFTNNTKQKLHSPDDNEANCLLLADSSFSAPALDFELRLYVVCNTYRKYSLFQETHQNFCALHDNICIV